MRTKLFALYAAVALLAVAAGPGLVAAADSGAGNTALAVSVNQPTDGEPTVSVTDNGTGVGNASVAVETVDNVTYDGAGTYTTDADGTVGLLAPNETVEVEVTAAVDNETATTTATLRTVNETEEEESFGQDVAAFIDALLEHRNASGGIGPAVSSFVVANNPGNAPDHAGPPEDKTRGPPADAGPNKDDADEEEEEDADEDEKKAGGPPDHAGPP
jgi:hypothetical protein